VENYPPACTGFVDSGGGDVLSTLLHTATQDILRLTLSAPCYQLAALNALEALVENFPPACTGFVDSFHKYTHP